MKKIARPVFMLVTLLIVIACATGCASIHISASNGNLAEVQRYVQEGADVNATVSGGFTPLMSAAKYAHLDVVKFLVDKGANVNAKDGNGTTPLIYAEIGGLQVAENARLEVVKFLVD